MKSFTVGFLLLPVAASSAFAALAAASTAATVAAMSSDALAVSTSVSTAAVHPSSGASVQYGSSSPFTSFTIEQIGKEFDLIKIDRDTLVLNIKK